MANFVQTTGVWRTANLQTRAPITPVRVTSLPGLVQDTATAIAMIQAQGGTVPADETLWGAFELQWAWADLRCYAVLGPPMVTTIGGMLAFDVDIWETQADSSGTPAIRETFIHQTGQSLDDVQDSFRDYLIRATVQGFSGDRREPRGNLTTDQAFDPRGLLARPAVQAMAGAVINRT